MLKDQAAAAPDLVAFLRNRAEDARNDADAYLELNFDRAADELHRLQAASDAGAPAVSEASPVEAEARRFVSAYENHELNAEGERAMRFAHALLSRASLSSEAARREAIEEAAEKARSHLEDWASDLAATRDQYIDAAACGMFNGHRITEEQARILARQFRERAEAVSESAEHTAKAIRSLK